MDYQQQGYPQMMPQQGFPPFGYGQQPAESAPNVPVIIIATGLITALITIAVLYWFVKKPGDELLANAYAQAEATNTKLQELSIISAQKERDAYAAAQAAQQAALIASQRETQCAETIRNAEISAQYAEAATKEAQQAFRNAVDNADKQIVELDNMRQQLVDKNQQCLSELDRLRNQAPSIMQASSIIEAPKVMAAPQIVDPIPAMDQSINNIAGIMSQFANALYGAPDLNVHNEMASKGSSLIKDEMNRFMQNPQITDDFKYNVYSPKSNALFEQYWRVVGEIAQRFSAPVGQDLGGFSNF